MNLQQFFAMSIGLSVEHVYYIAIAILACVLGAEIAGICMLIGKLRRARGGEIDLPNDEYDDNGEVNYAVAALSFGAVSATAELALFVLAIAAAVGALVLCLLLVVCYAKGYLLISAKAAKAAVEAEQAAKQAAKEAAEAAEAAEISEATEEFFYRDDDEEPEEAYDAYADNYEDDEAAQEAISNLIATEDDIMSEEYEAEEVAQDAEETVEEVEEAVEAAVVEQEPEVSVVQTVEQTVITEDAPAYAGQAPIIEKHIIETTREIIKETNTTTVTEGKGEQFSPATEEMMKAITEFMKLETQLRMEREVAVERPAENDESAPAFADTEDEELEADEIDTEDEIEAEDEAEREADAEENDDEYESDLFGNERIVGFDEETGCYIMARYRKSCEAKLMQSRPDTKKYYSAIRNALMGYEGTKERMSWTIDTYTNEHTQIAKINVRPRTLDLYLALEPSTLEDSVYRGRDVGGKKKYAETPFLYKVNSPRKLTLALELVQRACEELGLSPIDIEEVNYEEQYPFTDTETLVARGLIREYLREEKPAATFELDPDHVPQLVEEDETVIPANANFTWEFDNDQPEAEEPVAEEIIEAVIEAEPIEEEPVVEEEPAIEEEPVTEEVTAAPGTTTTTTTTHETIRTTERHYTERYYGADTETEVSEQTRTIEVLPEPAQEPIESEAEESISNVEEVTEEALAEEEIPEVAEELEELVEETEESFEEEIEEIAEVEEEIIDDEIIEDEIEEDYEKTTDEQAAQIQSAVAALFGDDIFEEDEPVEEEPAEEVVEEIVEEETVEEEIIEDEAEDETLEEVVEEYAEEIDEEAETEEVIYEEEYVDEEAEEIVYEEEYVDEEAEEVIYEEEYVEEEPETEEVIYEDEYSEEESEVEEVIYEEYYEEDPEAEEVVYEEEYYEEENEEVYEDIEGEEFEEIYEEEVEEIEEEEAPAPAPVQQPASDVVLLDVCVFDDYFDNGAIVNLETLKQVGLAPESATRLKVYASGALKGQFTVEANHFTLDAIKAIGDADGDSIMIR